MEDKGYIKIPREVLEWYIWTDKTVMMFFVTLLYHTKEKDFGWHQYKFNRGQMVTSINDLETITGLTSKVVRRCIDELVKSGLIEKESTNQYTVITVLNYDNYCV